MINKKTDKYIIIFLITILISGVWYFINNKKVKELNLDSIDMSEEKNENVTEENNKIIIYITGAVKKEGVYEIEKNSRINNAIEKAGGLAENANISTVNLADLLEDGTKIYIPTNDEIKKEKEITENIEDNDEIEPIKINEKNTEKGNNKKVNINKATQTELESLNRSRKGNSEIYYRV